jgi:hypothetical protein
MKNNKAQKKNSFFNLQQVGTVRRLKVAIEAGTCQLGMKRNLNLPNAVKKNETKFNKMNTLHMR